MLVPVIDNVKVPAVVELHDTLATPELVTLLGVIAPHVRPVGTLSVRLTVPVKPYNGLTVMVKAVEVPAVAAAGEEAARVKFGGILVTVNVALAECVSDPLVPVIVTV